MVEGVFTAKIVLFHQGSTELRRCENCVFFLPVNILTGVTRRLLGPHDTLPCVLIWILKNFVSSVLHFHLAVEGLTASSIISAQSSVLKFVKNWFNLPRNCTPGTVFHPDVLDLPFLPHLKQSAKLSYILAIERSVDPLIIELRHSILANRSDISSTVLDCLSAAKASVANIHSATFKNHARYNLRTFCSH